MALKPYYGKNNLYGWNKNKGYGTEEHRKVIKNMDLQNTTEKHLLQGSYKYYFSHLKNNTLTIHILIVHQLYLHVLTSFYDNNISLVQERQEHPPLNNLFQEVVDIYSTNCL